MNTLPEMWKTLPIRKIDRYGWSLYDPLWASFHTLHFMRRWLMCMGKNYELN